MGNIQDIENLEKEIDRIDREFRERIKRIKLGLKQEIEHHKTWFNLCKQKIKILKAKTKR